MPRMEAQMIFTDNFLGNTEYFVKTIAACILWTINLFTGYKSAVINIEGI
jgi:hypothetical protein